MIAIATHEKPALAGSRLIKAASKTTAKSPARIPPLVPPKNFAAIKPAGNAVPMRPADVATTPNIDTASTGSVCRSFK